MDLQTYKNKKVAILGLGKAGIELANFLMGKLNQFVISGEANNREKRKLLARAAEFESQSFAIVPIDEMRKTIFEQDLIILTSQYYGFEHEVALAEEKGIEVLNDVDFVSLMLTKPVIGITGSNGKSSTAWLLKQILEKSGKTVFLGGSFFDCFVHALDNVYDFNIFELNSSALTRCRKLQLDIAVITNFSPNHAERHGGHENYLNTKLRIIDFLKKDASLIYNAHVKVLEERVNKKSGNFRVVPVFLGGDEKCYITNSLKKVDLALLGGGKLEASGFSLSGFNHFENLLIATTVAYSLGLRETSIERTIPSLFGLPFRFQKVKVVNGVEIYNDAFSTNSSSTAWALFTLKKDVILIAGGQYGSGMCYHALREYLERHVKCLIIYGVDRKRFLQTWGDYTESYCVEDIPDALSLAFKKASPGDKILYSPCAKPYDEYVQGVQGRGGFFNQCLGEMTRGSDPELNRALRGLR